MRLSFAFYEDDVGHSPVLDFLFSRSSKEQYKCFTYVRDLVVFVHGVKKKTPKTKPSDIALAIKRMQELKS